MAEVFDAYRKPKEGLKEELADIVIYLLGLSEMLGINLEEEFDKKIIKNKIDHIRKLVELRLE